MLANRQSLSHFCRCLSKWTSCIFQKRQPDLLQLLGYNYHGAQSFHRDTLVFNHTCANHSFIFRLPGKSDCSVHFNNFQTGLN